MDASQSVDMGLPVRCVDLPKGNDATPLPSLQDVGEPRILWQKTYEDTGLFGLDGMLALAGERLAFISGPALWLLDRSGNVIAHLMEGPAWAAPAQGPVADKDGNFYFATQAVYSVRPDGTIRWTKGFGPNKSPFEELTLTSRPLLSPSGILYVAATDGFYYALRAADGSILWTHSISTTQQDESYYNGLGGGNYIFADVAYTADSGEVSGLPQVNGVPSKRLPVYSVFYAEQFINGKTLYGYVLDRCGQVLWSCVNALGTWSQFRLVGFHGEDLVAGTEQVYIYDQTGKILRGPEPLPGIPQVLGADNIFYGFECPMPDQELTLSAYSWDGLQRLWSLNLGKGCSNSGAVLADDGVLYLAKGIGSGQPVEIIAVQTQSPGLAHTAQPTWLYNNRRTGWLE